MGKYALFLATTKTTKGEMQAYFLGSLPERPLRCWLLILHRLLINVLDAPANIWEKLVGW